MIKKSDCERRSRVAQLVRALCCTICVASSKSCTVQMTFVSFCNNSIQYHSHEVFKMYLINVWKQMVHVILYSVVVFTLTFWVRDLGSIPLQHYFVFFWKNNQTLRAKITLFPRKDLHLNLPKWSTNTTCSFKPKKFMVGHFDLDQYSCLRKN